MTSPSPTATPVSLLSSKQYDRALLSATLFLPLLGAFWFGIASIWNLDYSEQIAGTIAVLNVLLGGLAAASKKLYDVSGAKYVGVVNVTVDDAGKKIYELDMGDELDNLDKKSEITFKVNTQ